MSILMVPASKCTVSPSNVRKVQDENADLMLRASIVARGVLQNLVGFAVPKKKGQYEITAGGRRLAQVQAAIADGSLPATFEIPVLALDKRDDATETSLAENFIRLGMNPADEAIAFRHIIVTEGKTPADIAKRYGITERFVLGRLRLANLAEEVFTALRDGKMTLDMAQAYAATSDTIQQAAVFRTHGVHGHPNSVRRAVTTAGYSGEHPKVKIIDRDEYEAAGGKFDGDLFTDDATEVWLDTALVDALAAKKLHEIAEATRAEHGFGEIRVARSPFNLWDDTQDLQPFVPPVREPTAEEQAEAQTIAEELEDLEARAEFGEELGVEEEARITALQEQYETLTAPTATLTDEEKSRVIAFVQLRNDGKVYLSNELYVQPAADENDDTDQDADNSGDDAPKTDGAGPGTTAAAAPEKTGVSQRLAAELATQKTELLALHVASDPHFAFDLAVFIMADRVMDDDYKRRMELGITHGQIPSELRSPTPQAIVSDFKSDTQAATALKELQDGLDKSWHASGDVRVRFDAFRALSDDAKAAWLGWTVARTLRPTEHGRTGAAFLDHLGAQLGIDVATWWRPTAANYFDRGSKKLALSAIGEIGGTELTSRYSASKKADLAAAAEKLFGGNAIVEPEYRPALIGWVPVEMRFGEVGTGDDHATTDETTNRSDHTRATEPPAANPADQDLHDLDPLEAFA